MQGPQTNLVYALARAVVCLLNTERLKPHVPAKRRSLYPGRALQAPNTRQPLDCAEYVFMAFNRRGSKMQQYSRIHGDGTAIPLWKAVLGIFLPSLVAFVVLDGIWISVVAGNFYNTNLKPILKPNVDYAAAALSWICIVAINQVFVLPRTSNGRPLYESLVQVRVWPWLTTCRVHRMTSLRCFPCLWPANAAAVTHACSPTATAALHRPSHTCSKSCEAAFKLLRVLLLATGCHTRSAAVRHSGPHQLCAAYGMVLASGTY